jgi:transcriptional regulator with XRE-family HTH domain
VYDVGSLQTLSVGCQVDRLKNFRVENDLTQNQMANIMGCSQQHYSYIERGKQTPTVEHMAALYQAFGVTAADLGYDLIPTVRIVSVGATQGQSA